MKPVYQIEKDNKEIKILRDETPLHPREDYEPCSEIATFHRRYSFGGHEDIKDVLSGIDVTDKDYERIMDSGSLAEIIEILEKYVVAILPIYMYDHSGISLSTTPFSCQWDSGTLGFIYVTREKMMEWQPSWKRMTAHRIKTVKAWLVAEIDVLDKFQSGEVYGFQCFEDGEEIDACWGFYDFTNMADHMTEEFSDLFTELMEKENLQWQTSTSPF